MATKEKIEITGELALADIASGMSKKEIADKYGVSGQKVAGVIRAYKVQEKEDATGAKDELIPPEVFAKKANVLLDTNMGSSVVLTNDEFIEYSLANGRTKTGRPQAVKTQLNTGELRILLNLRSRGATPDGIKELIHDLHGATERDIIKVAYALCMEEESKPMDILRQLNIKVPTRNEY